MLWFVLVFMCHHGMFDGQVFLGFVGDQGVIAAPIQRFFKGGLIKVKRYAEMIGNDFDLLGLFPLFRTTFFLVL
jgi:hypothetical protein